MSARRLQRGFTARRARGFILLPVVLALTLVAAVAFLLNREGGMNMQMAAGGLQADSARYVAEAGLAQINTQTQGRNCTGYTDLPTTFGAGSFSATVNPKSGTPVTLASTATLAGGATSTLTRSNVTMRKTTPYVMTLQPGAAGMDAYIDFNNQTRNYGAATSFIFDGTQVGLLQFSLSAIPAGAYIQTAQLGLYATNSSVTSSDTLTVYRLTRAWTEGTMNGSGTADGATWRTADGTNAWTLADFDSASGVTTAFYGVIGWNYFDLTPLVSNWTAGSYPNYGMFLIASAGISNGNLASSDYATSSQRPTLTVTFLPPCGWVAPGVTLPASQDTWIDSTGSSAANYGGSTSFTVTNGSNKGRGLVRFDLSSIPTSTVLTSATLRLWAGSFSPKVDSILTVNRVADAWVEGTRDGSGAANGATWKKRDPINNLSWSAGFGIYWGFGSGAPTSTSAISSSFSSGWVEWDVTALAQQWITSPAQNYGAGVLIDTTSAVIFNSREMTVYQPQLVLTY